MPTIATEWAEIIDREDDQETPPGADRLINLNTTLANNNNNNNIVMLCRNNNAWPKEALFYNNHKMTHAFKSELPVNYKKSQGSLGNEVFRQCLQCQFIYQRVILCQNDLNYTPKHGNLK